MKTLKKGDTIGIIAPSSPITLDLKFLLDNAIKKFDDFGFEIVLADNLLKKDKYNISGGEPEDRAMDLNNMFADPNVNAVYCAHGGNTANQLLPFIDYDQIKRNPKIFLGLSDTDVLHLAINTRAGIFTFNGSDPKSGRGFDLDIDYTWQSFQDRLMGGKKIILPVSQRKTIRGGDAEGRLLGCNLNSMMKLIGTEYFPDFKDSLLFLEAYTINEVNAAWKLTQLKQIGVFDKINGIVIGYIYGFQDKEMIVKNNIKHNFEDIVLDITREYDFPILKTDDFGHRCPTCFLPIGARVRMDADSKAIEIIEDFLDEN